MNNSIRNRQRGITSAIAMIFLVTMTLMALGFYAMTSTATSLAKNDRRTAKSLLAAESGIQFMRNRLAHVNIPAGTAPANLLTELYNDLSVDNTILGNIGSAPVTRTGNIITIPAITTDSAENSGFTVTLTDVGSVGEIVCTIRGYSGKTGSTSGLAQKGVRLDFNRKAINTSIFSNAVATKGKFNMIKGAITGVSGVSSDSIIKVMSAQKTAGAITMSGGTIGSAAGGELGVLIDANADGKPDLTATTISGGSVHGTTNITTIKNNYVKLVAEPEFPTVDTTSIAGYATNTYSGQSSGTLQNMRIPAGANPDFTGNVTIQGVLYIESPNNVKFRGNTNMQGFIVFENKNTSLVNTIDGSGNFTYGDLPSDAKFDPLRAITGISILAPTTAVTMGGSVDSQVRGNMILGSFASSGSADITISKGSIITMDPSATSATFNGKNVKFLSVGADNQPPNFVNFTTKLMPTEGSYIELN
jgi:Tfp pilus assembly protein PilX